MNKVLYLATLLLIIAGCGSPDGSTWLISTSKDTLTVAEIGTIWNELDGSARQRFLSKDNPVGEFLFAVGRKTIITEEISNDRYLYSQINQNMRECWLRSSAFIAYKDTLSTSIQSSLTELDLSNYAVLFGSIVWYSSEDGRKLGPERLPDLPWELAFAFDTLPVGSSVECDGIVYTMDSIVISDQELIEATLANSEQFTASTRENLTESRTLRHLSSLRGELLETFSYDSSKVAKYCNNRNVLDGSEVLACWESGSITVEEFDAITAFLALGNQGNPESPPWVIHNLKNQAKLIHIANIYATQYPQDYDNMMEDADSFALDQASEILFRENVTDRIEITDDLLRERFESMNSLPIVPESRVFLSVIIPGGLLEEAITLLEDGDALFDFGHPGYTEFLQPGNEYLSRPVFPTELPHGMDVLLFQLEEDNTSWQRPLEIEEDLYVIYRLVEIIHPHTASFEQLQSSIRRNLIMHLEEQSTMEWFCELEASHQYRINSEILSKLPIDPSAWSDL